MKKISLKLLISLIVFIVLWTACFLLICCLFIEIYGKTRTALYWSASVFMLLNGLLWLILAIHANAKQRKKMRNSLISAEILGTGVGGIGFIVCSFLFIKDLCVSFLLVITVALVFLGAFLFFYMNKKHDEEEERKQQQASKEEQD